MLPLNPAQNNQEENALFFVSLKIILRNDDGAVLLLKLPPTSAMAGYYDLPGGRIRGGEEKIPFREIIAREIREEIGDITFKLCEVPAAVGRHFYVSKKTHKEQNLFWIFLEAQYVYGKIEISDEHTKYEWIHITEDNVDKLFIKGALEGMWSYLHKKFHSSVWSKTM